MGPGVGFDNLTLLPLPFVFHAEKESKTLFLT